MEVVGLTGALERKTLISNQRLKINFCIHGHAPHMDNPTMFSFFASSQTYISAKITFIGARVILWPKVRGARQSEETGQPQVVFWQLVGQDVTQWSCGLPQKLKPLIRKPDATHTLHELCSSIQHNSQPQGSHKLDHADTVQ